MNNENMVVVRNEAGSIILCVIDFSEGSKDALCTAVNIATSTKSKLTVLYPYRLNQPRNVSDISQWKKSIETDADNNFTRMTGSLLKESNITCDFKAEVGFVDDRIEAFTQKHNVGLIVIGSELAHKSDGALVDLYETLNSPLLIVPKTRILQS